jgi:hypothetical protein
VLDDLHWAAKPTLLLLRHILRSAELAGAAAADLAAVPAGRDGAPGGARLMLIATYRDTEAHQPHLAEFLADLRRESGVERLALSGLDEAGVAAVIELTAGHRLDEQARALVRGLQSETEGNPFFIGEVIRHLAESGAVVQRDGAWVMTPDLFRIGIPDGVREVIGRRMSRLAAATADTLRLAAVMGRDFDLGILGTVSDLGDAELLQAMDQAVTARLVEETGFEAYRFAHNLVRSTLYDQVNPTRRVRWHRAIAEGLVRRRPDDVTALAYHYNQAAAGGSIDQAIEYATRAGDQASERLAFDQALVFYRQALAVLDSTGDGDPRRRCELLIRLGQAQRDTGDAAHRATLLEAAALAQRAAHSQALVQAALANNRGWASTTGLVDPERIAVLEAALSAASDADGDARARLLATLGAELAFDPDWKRRRALSDEALAIARRLGVPTTLAHVLRLRFVAWLAPDTLAERVANTAEHLAVTSRIPDPVSSFSAAWQRLWVAIEAADIDAVDGSLQHAERLANESGVPQLRSLVAMQRSWRAWLAGRLAEAEEQATRQLEIGQSSGVPESLQVFGAQLWMIRWAQGRLGEIEPLFGQAVAAAPHLPGLRAALAVLYCETDRPEQADDLLRNDAAGGFTSFPYDQFWLANMTANVRVYAHLGSPGPCQSLYDLLAPFHDQIAFQGAIVTGPVSEYLGYLATALQRFDAAERHFADAVARAERLQAPIVLAHTRLEWAAMHGHRCQPGDTDRARRLIDLSLASATEYGLGGVEQRARQTLGRLSAA